MTHIWHDTDRDGYGSKFAAWSSPGGQEFNYVPLFDRKRPPTQALNALQDCDHVYILDFSFEPSVLTTIAERVGIDGKVHVIDHHESFAKQWAEYLYTDPKRREGYLRIVADNITATTKNESGNVFVTMNLRQSAAALSWEQFRHDIYGPLPKILAHIQDYDLWNWKLDSTAEILAGFDSHGIKDMSNYQRAMEDPAYMNTLLQEGIAIKRFSDDVEMSIANHATTFDLLGVPIPMVQCHGIFASKVGHRILDNPLYAVSPMVFLYRIDWDGSLAIGIRSREGFNAANFAALFDGGGHPKAAGFRTTFPFKPSLVQTKKIDTMLSDYYAD